MKINHVIRTLVLSDFFINAGFSVFAPIFAVFVTKQIPDGSLQVIGFAAALTQIFKVTLQIPIARYLDRNHGEYDDFYSMVFGSFLISLVPFLYLFASLPAHVYIFSAVYGAGLAFLVPPWYAIFTRHIDKMKENIEWSMDSVAIGIASAGTAALGGILATRLGFQAVFLLGGVLAIIGSVLQLKIYKDLRKKVKTGTVKPVDGKL